ncbi:MAG: hypothetical protein ABSF23_03660 [Terracidiphilus sp.]|jgi:hypothetical protein
MNTCLANAQAVFDLARGYTLSAGLAAEVDWQRSTDFASFSETQLLRETAWVILCSGFREAIVRRIFDHISLCFLDWESAAQILENRDICVKAAMDSLRNEAKLNAIAACAERIANVGFESLKEAVIRDPIPELQKFPFIGPITVWHLAKNLGLNVAKPDRHLARLASRCGYPSAGALCEDIANRNNEEIKVVDLILWRFLADNPGLPFAHAADGIGMTNQPTSLAPPPCQPPGAAHLQPANPLTH